MAFPSRALLAITVGAPLLGLRTPAPSPVPLPAEKAALTIHLERLVKDHAIPMRPDHVFDTGDTVRFRLSSRMEGFLYVIDQGSSGEYTVLFPASGSQNGNSIQNGTEYLVPAVGDGWFEIYGRPGFDTVYFLLSPTPLGMSATTPAVPAPTGPATAAPSPKEALPPSMTPRCNDAIFQARGECVDSSAGPAPLARGAPLPPQISAAAPRASRDLVLSHADDDTVSVANPVSGPVVYTFRLAHR